MPTLLRQGIVKPNKQRIIEGSTLLERAQKALDTLRRKDVGGERMSAKKGWSGAYPILNRDKFVKDCSRAIKSFKK